ncbi:6719_t:CDS:2, partial [Paraglomus occultum]
TEVRPSSQTVIQQWKWRITPLTHKSFALMAAGSMGIVFMTTCAQNALKSQMERICKKITYYLVHGNFDVDKAENLVEPTISGTKSTNEPSDSINTTDTQAVSGEAVETEKPLIHQPGNVSAAQSTVQDSPPPRPVQTIKSRCFLCRAKIPLAKQTVNKCRCEYIYCDLHKVPDKHDCDFDFAKMGKDILAKNNPKLNDVHKGGRSFNRID